MNNNSAEWQREYYLTHDKYRMQGQGTDCYKVVKSLTRILQLPTIAKLTTDNESVIGDFRLNRGEYGLEPYDEYAIKVDDTYDGGEHPEWGIRLPFRSERVWQPAGTVAANRARFPTYTELCDGSELSGADTANLAAYDMSLETAVSEPKG